MMILLPKKDPQALSDLEQSVSAEKVNEWWSKLRWQTVDVTFPKFRLETDVPLTSALASLGIVGVFDPRKADLSSINGGKEPWWLDWILQQGSYVNVDEEGTEAAAVTGGGGIGAMEPRAVVFRADHPFIFLIRDTRTGCILLGLTRKAREIAPFADLEKRERNISEKKMGGKTVLFSFPQIQDERVIFLSAIFLGVLVPLLSCNSCLSWFLSLFRKLPGGLGVFR